MAATIPFDPYTTGNASGNFSVASDGWVQGLAMDDPDYRNWLTGGVLASTETLPMWGGCAINEALNAINVPLVGTNNPIGNLITRATNVTVGAAGQVTGFSVYNQAYAMPITSSSQVPLSASGGPVNFFRLGSRARIPVLVAPTFAASLSGSIRQQVSWDYINQQLVPYAAAYAQGTITGATWAATGTGQISFAVGTDYTSELAAGDIVNTANIVMTGSGTSLNGQWVVKSVSSGAVVVQATPTNTYQTYSSAGNVLAGGGALTVEVIGVQQTNCKVVSYVASPQSANWSNNGALAMIQLG